MVKIAVVHENIFVRKGLEVIIKDYNFINDIEKTDIIICDTENLEKLLNLEVKILLITDCTDILILKSFIIKGISGLLQLSSSPEELHEAIKDVSNGKVYFAEKHRSVFLQSKVDFHEYFSPKQIEILRYLSKEMKTKDIVEKLNVTRKTVESHYKVMKLKIGVRRNEELRNFARSKVLMQLFSDVC